jgi:hypothetical protein
MNAQIAQAIQFVVLARISNALMNQERLSTTYTNSRRRGRYFESCVAREAFRSGVRGRNQIELQDGRTAKTKSGCKCQGHRVLREEKDCDRRKGKFTAALQMSMLTF